jgi:serine/threonine protein kinase
MEGKRGGVAFFATRVWEIRARRFRWPSAALPWNAARLPLMVDPADVPKPAAPAAGRESPCLSPVELTNLLPQYEVERVIGVGGMGAVYLARQRSLDRWVALKLLPAREDAEAAGHFIREARAMARLVHPHIVAVYDFGQTADGHFFLAMEYVDGGDLHRRTLAGEVTPERARQVIAQVCEALQFAHGQGVIHRDIKPANILITSDWQVKVADFGLARDLQAAGTPDEAEYGTPDYVAPERWTAGAAVDHRADVYSLGVVIHELLTGKTPAAAGSRAGRGLPPGFAGVLSKCLMHDPARRYGSATEVRRALLEAATAAPSPARAAPAAAPMPRPPATTAANAARAVQRREWVEQVFWTLISLLVLAALGWLVWNDHFKPASPPPSATSPS